MSPDAIDLPPLDPCDRGDLRDRLVARTRELFQLLTVALETSPRSASDAVAVDLRSIRNMRAVPSVELVTRVGSGLGLDPEVAIGVVASEPECSVARDALRASLAAADLADDAPRISAIATRLAIHADRPGDLALAQLAEARASIARGDLDAAASHAGNARDIGLDSNDRVIASMLAGAARFDGTLGSPWEHGPRRTEALDWILEACDPGALDGCPGTRDSGFREAFGLAEGRRSPCRVRCWLDETLSAGISPEARAWVASSIALAALRRIATVDDAPAEVEPLVHLFVKAQLALGELARDTVGDARGAAESRLSRVVFAEWSTRAVQEGLDGFLIDEADADEIARACMRLDGARGRHGQPQLSIFTHLRKRSLDASSGESWMVGLVQFPHAAKACPESRSEDPC